MQSPVKFIRLRLHFGAPLQPKRGLATAAQSSFSLTALDTTQVDHQTYTRESKQGRPVVGIRNSHDQWCRANRIVFPMTLSVMKIRRWFDVRPELLIDRNEKFPQTSYTPPEEIRSADHPASGVKIDQRNRLRLCHQTPLQAPCLPTPTRTLDSLTPALGS